MTDFDDFEFAEYEEKAPHQQNESNNNKEVDNNLPETQQDINVKANTNLIEVMNQESEEKITNDKDHKTSHIEKNIENEVKGVNEEVEKKTDLQDHIGEDYDFEFAENNNIHIEHLQNNTLIYTKESIENKNIDTVNINDTSDAKDIKPEILIDSNEILEKFVDNNSTFTKPNITEIDSSQENKNARENVDPNTCSNLNEETFKFSSEERQEEIKVSNDVVNNDNIETEKNKIKIDKEHSHTDKLFNDKLVSEENNVVEDNKENEEDLSDKLVKSEEAVDNILGDDVKNEVIEEDTVKDSIKINEDLFVQNNQNKEEIIEMTDQKLVTVNNEDKQSIDIEIQTTNNNQNTENISNNDHISNKENTEVTGIINQDEKTVDKLVHEGDNNNKPEPETNNIQFDEFEFEEFEDVSGNAKQDNIVNAINPSETQKKETVKEEENKVDFNEDNFEFEEFEGEKNQEKEVVVQETLPELNQIYNNLLNSFKETSVINQNYFDETGVLPQEIAENTKEIIEDQSFIPNRISDYSIDIDKTNTSLSIFLNKIRSYKRDKEVVFRNVEVKEMIAHNITNEKELKGKYQNDMFYKDITNVSRGVIKKIYFKLIDSKNIYDTMFNIKQGKQKKKLSDKNLLNMINDQLEINERDFNFDDDGTEKNPDFTGNNENTVEKEKNLPDYEFNDEEDEFEDHTTATNKKENNLIDNDISKVIFSLVIDNKSTVDSHKNVAESESNNNENLNKMAEENVTVNYDENNILEMLKNYGIKLNDPAVNNIPPNTNNENTNDRINQFVSKLPNYYYLVSKTVEYPDSFFNFS